MRSDLIFDHMDCAVGDHDIRPTVIVVVNECCTETRKGCGRDIESSHGACILELSAMAKITIKSCFLASKMRDEDVVVPRAVDIRDIDAHTGFGRAIDIYRHAALKRF